MIYPAIKISYNDTEIPRLTLDDWLLKHQIQTYYKFACKKLTIIIYKKNEGLMRRFSLINGNQTYLTEGSHYTKL